MMVTRTQATTSYHQTKIERELPSHGSFKVINPDEFGPFGAYFGTEAINQRYDKMMVVDEIVRKIDLININELKFILQ